MEKKKLKTITVETDELSPVDMNLLAEHIIKVSDAFEAINNSKLANRAILLLIHDLSKVPMGDIKLVLHNARLLKKYFTK